MDADSARERAPLPETSSRPPRGRVQVVVAYDGLAGDPEGRFAAGELRERRRREARAGGAHLGLTRYEFLDQPEGHLPSPQELLAGARLLAERVRALAIDTVYAPWVGEHHVDHHVLGRAARLALALAGFRGRAWGYEVWTPLVATWIVDVSAVHARKVAALSEHTSQLAYHDIRAKGLALSAQRAMYLAPEATHGEAFAPLGEPSGSDRALL